MGSGRAYTKSGSVEKFESSQWSTPLWSSSSATGTVSIPDTNGNYTVTAPSGYTENTTGGTITCTTHYGGVAKVFYFEITQYTNVIINFTATAYEDRGIYYIAVHTNYNRLPCDVFVSIECEIKQIHQFVTMTCKFAVDDIEYTQTITSSDVVILSVTLSPSTYKDDKNGINYYFYCAY